VAVSRRYHFNAPFVIFCAVVLAIGLAALNSQNNLLFWIFGALVGALFVSGVVSGLMMMALDVRRIDPGHGTVGEPLIVRYQIRNRSRWVPVFDIEVEDLAEASTPFWRRQADAASALLRNRLRVAAARSDFHAQQAARSGATFQRLMRPARAWVMHVGPRETVHGEAVFWPAARGEARFETIRIRTSFPFGLVRKSIAVRQPAHTLVYPRLFALRRGVLRAFGGEGPMGMKVTSRAGGGDDYYGLREYRVGDPLRHIAWKRTAGREEIVCVEHAQPSPPRMRVLLNLAAEGVTRRLEEEAISLAASILHAADGAGFEVGLSILGRPQPTLPVRRSHRHLTKMMAALASIDLERPPAGRPPASHRHLDSMGLVVIHPDRVDQTVGRADAWHLSARQVDQLTSVPLGWDPTRNPQLRPAPRPESETAA
jgi:uncharacterized protein (DUF58 family)